MHSEEFRTEYLVHGIYSTKDKKQGREYRFPKCSGCSTNERLYSSDTGIPVFHKTLLDVA